MNETRQPVITGRRILLHLGFWISYIALAIFTELNLPSSCSAPMGWDAFMQSLVAQTLVMIVKASVAYVLMYRTIPRWLTQRNRGSVFLEAGAYVLAGLLVYRILIHMFIWPYLYKLPMSNEPLELAARVMYTLFDMFEVIGIAVSIRLVRMRLAALRREKALVKEKLRAEMRHLKAQMNPHFLFNSLNTLYALSRQQSGQTSEAVMRLSQIMRYMLYESEKQLTTLEQELKLMQDYIGMQQLRFGDKVVVEQDISVDDDQGLITPLFLFPLLENAFKHGVGTAAEISRIRVRVILKEGVLQVHTHNPAAETSLPVEREGIGLTNLRRQLELLYGDFSLEYGEKDGFFSVDLRIDTRTYAGNELFDRGR